MGEGGQGLDEEVCDEEVKVVVVSVNGFVEGSVMFDDHGHRCKSTGGVIGVESSHDQALEALCSTSSRLQTCISYSVAPKILIPLWFLVAEAIDSSPS